MPQQPERGNVCLPSDSLLGGRASHNPNSYNTGFTKNGKRALSPPQLSHPVMCYPGLISLTGKHHVLPCFCAFAYAIYFRLPALSIHLLHFSKSYSFFKDQDSSLEKKKKRVHSSTTSLSSPSSLPFLLFGSTGSDPKSTPS